MYHLYENNVEAATLSITRELQPDDFEDDTNLMYSIATYIAENSETLNLVEGERLYVIGSFFFRLYFKNKMDRSKQIFLNFRKT